MADIHGAPDPSMMTPEQSLPPAPLEDLAAAAAAAERLGDARAAESLAILESPQGAGAPDLLSGWTGGWSAGVMPSADPDNGGYGGA
jgi:hypothetical protein